MGQEILVAERTQGFAGDTLECLKERAFIPNDLGDFLARDPDGEIIAAVEGGLGRGAENGSRAEIMNEAAEPTKDGVKE